jgi:hypothetical protein
MNQQPALSSLHTTQSFLSEYVIVGGLTFSLGVSE